ncbi:hypothetical protein OROGR_003738 [Orobanche gracilis]
MEDLEQQMERYRREFRERQTVGAASEATTRDICLQRWEISLDPSLVAPRMFDEIPEKKTEMGNLCMQGKTEVIVEQLPLGMQTAPVEVLKLQTKKQI